MDREAWWAIVHRVTKELDMTWKLRNNKNSRTADLPNKIGPIM